MNRSLWKMRLNKPHGREFVRMLHPNTIRTTFVKAFSIKVSVSAVTTSGCDYSTYIVPEAGHSSTQSCRNDREIREHSHCSMSTALSLHLAKCVTQISEFKLDVSALIARFIGVVIKPCRSACNFSDWRSHLLSQRADANMLKFLKDLGEVRFSRPHLFLSTVSTRLSSCRNFFVTGSRSCCAIES